MIFMWQNVLIFNNIRILDVILIMSDQIFHIICCPEFHSFGSLQTTDIYDGFEVYVTLPGIIMMTKYTAQCLA